jgi:hypothetical protein
MMMHNPRRRIWSHQHGRHPRAEGRCLQMVHTGLALSRTRIELRRFSIMRMARREAHYRGYKIDGELKGRSWVLHVHPILPDLPILRFSSFQVVQSTWPKAVGEAVRRVDELLALSINP